MSLQLQLKFLCHQFHLDLELEVLLELALDFQSKMVSEFALELVLWVGGEFEISIRYGGGLFVGDLFV